MERVNPDAQEKRFRAQFVRRAIETEAPLLATALHRYATAEKMDWEQLARSLECTVDALNNVALCRPPRPEHFVDDVWAIAADYIDPDLLLSLLRRIQVLEAFADADRAAEDQNTYHAAAGATLLAAREREEHKDKREEGNDAAMAGDGTTDPESATQNPIPPEEGHD